MPLLRLGKRGLRIAWRIGVALVGLALVALGVVLLVTPGPGLLVIPAGLAVLALEFEAPRRWLDRLREELRS